MRLAPAALFLLLASPCLASTETAPFETFTVELEREAPRTAVKVVARSDGTVALTLADGTVEYVQATHIRSIRDQDRYDWTSYVLRDRGSLGTGREPRMRLPEHYRPFRWRPGPSSTCGGYMVTEAALLWPASVLDNVYLVVEDGVAKNIGKSRSVGATLLFGVTPDWTQTGVRARFVQWFSGDVSVNISPGVIFSGSGVGSTDVIVPQFTAQAGVNMGGRVGLVVDVFTVHLRDNNGFDAPNDTRDTRWQVGLRVGAVPGLIATLPALVLGSLIQTGGE